MIKFILDLINKIFKNTNKMKQEEIVTPVDLEIVYVLLDNGHGLETAGKCSPLWPNGQKLIEAEFSRDIVIRLFGSTSINKRVQLINVVPETNDIELSTRSSRIAAYCKEYGVKNCFTISIHANGGGGTGWEVLARNSDMDKRYPKRAAEFSSESYVKTTKLSQEMAELAGQVAKSDLEDFKIRQEYANKLYKEQNVHILREIPCPGILTENLFMDTWKDCEFILSEDGRQQIANLHVDIINRIVDKFF